MDLITKLRAKLDAVEQVARAATPGPWAWSHLGHPYKYGLTAGGQVVLPSAAPDIYPHRDDAAHIALHDPAATLRMVAAHRKILDLHVATDTAETFGEVSTITYCPICRDDGECPTLEALAEGYGIEP